MRRVGVLLSGCGRHDGSEVQETVLLLLALGRRGFRAIAIAPDVEQRDVVDHLSGNVVEDAVPRHVLREAARLIRGTVQPLGEVSAAELDALVIPGGAGVVKNLLLPLEGSPLGGPLRPEVRRLLDELAARGAPVGAVGLGEVVVARHQDRPLTDAAVACAPTEVRIDAERAVVFTPGFMATDRISEAAEGVDRLVEELDRRLADRPGRGSAV